MLPHEHLSRVERLKRQENTQTLWEADINASFNYNSENSISDTEKFTGGPSKISYNLKEASLRQKEFYYQVSLPHYKEHEYVSQSVAQYFKFLQLKALKKQLFIVPTYAIDLVWHAHQCDPIRYEDDCRAILGYVLPHDDTVNDRAPASKLNNSYEETCAEWLKLFKKKYFFAGGMYRGDSKSEHYGNTGFDFALSYHIVNSKAAYELQLTKMSLVKEFGSQKANLKVKISHPFNINGEISLEKPLKVPKNQVEISFDSPKPISIDINYKFEDSVLTKLKNLFKSDSNYMQKEGTLSVPIAKTKQLLKCISMYQ